MRAERKFSVGDVVACVTPPEQPCGDMTVVAVEPYEDHTWVVSLEVDGISHGNLLQNELRLVSRGNHTEMLPLASRTREEAVFALGYNSLREGPTESFQAAALLLRDIDPVSQAHMRLAAKRILQWVPLPREGDLI